MNRNLIDANCLISFTTQRSKHQLEIMTDVFQEASHGEASLVLTGQALSEYVYVLESVYGIEPGAISKNVSDLWKNPGVDFHPGYFPRKMLEFWPENIKDYGDAVLAACGAELKIPILTFDQPFAAELSNLKLQFKLLK